MALALFFALGYWIGSFRDRDTIAACAAGVGGIAIAVGEIQDALQGRALLVLATLFGFVNFSLYMVIRSAGGTTLGVIEAVVGTYIIVAALFLYLSRHVVRGTRSPPRWPRPVGAILGAILISFSVAAVLGG